MNQCDAGHFYDETKHSTCPYCGVALDLGGAEPPKTVPLRQTDSTDASPKTVPLYGGTTPPTAPAGATKRLVREALGMDPVVGWLVCLEGPDKGRDFRLHSEKNFIGRDISMDVCIPGDETISRQKHATIAFEPKKRNFWLIPGESTGLAYLNGDVVYAATVLKDRDTIELGKSKFVLVPFVNDSFSWQE